MALLVGLAAWAWRVALLLLAAGAAHGLPAVAAGAAKATRMTVEMADDRFVPNHIEFRRGVRYLLRLENHGKYLHEFSAPAFFAAARVGNPRVLSNGGKEIDLQSGESKQVTVTPLRSGTFALTCPDHDWDGMTGEIVVR